MKVEKVEKLVGNLHDKTEYVIQTLNHGLVLKEVHKAIKLAWLKMLG